MPTMSQETWQGKKVHHVWYLPWPLHTVSAAKICTQQVLPWEKKESTHGNRQIKSNLYVGLDIILRTNNVD